MSDNTLIAILCTLMILCLILTRGEPDIIDAIIYNLTGGALKQP